MALRFQQPNLSVPKTKNEGILEGMQPGITALQNLPSTIAYFKAHKAEQDIKNQALALQQRQSTSEYGTGEAAPVSYQNAGGPGSSFLPPTLDPNAVGVAQEETPQQERERIGLKAYGAETDRIKAQRAPKPTYFVDQNQMKFYDSSMKEVSSIPDGADVKMLSREPAKRDPNASVSAANKLSTDFGKAYNFLYSLNQNLKTLKSDRAGKNEIVFGALRPSAGQGLIGKLSRAVGAGGPTQSSFASNVGKTLDIYRHDITGAAAGFPEMQKLEGRLPTTAEKEENFEKKSIDSLNIGIDVLKKNIERYKARGIDTDIYEQQLGELQSQVESYGAQDPVHQEAIDLLNANKKIINDETVAAAEKFLKAKKGKSK